MSLSRRRVGWLVVGVVASALVGWHSLSQADDASFQPTVQAAFQNDKLLIAVDLPSDKAGPTSDVIVEVLDKGQSVAKGMRRVYEPVDRKVSADFDLKVEAKDKDRLTIKVSLKDGPSKEMPLNGVLLVKGHETTLLGGKEFYPGSQASMQVQVQAIKSIVESTGAAGATVRVTLRDEKGTKSYDLGGTRTDAKGLATVALAVPTVEAGQYVLEVTTKSRLGEEKLVHQVRVKTDGKILLVTDKPIYQPGQLMHLRALVLQSYDMKPIAQRDLLFEIEDNKGNKVFKKSFKTSDFGIASVDFQLADEVNMGDYHLRAVVGDLRAEKTVQVKRYVLPKFKTAVTTDKTF
jgi:5-hydroxyisourate hydrolase-like protein (transthyretin family)